MKDEKYPQKPSKFIYNSPSKDCVNTTPIKSALKKSNYEIGPFIEIMNDLNRTKMRLNNLNVKRNIERTEENKEN